MLDDFGFFMFLCFSMFICSYFIGSLPLFGNLGESKIRLISVFGAGLLIGTAFGVVVPEGIDAMQAGVHREAAAKANHPEVLAAVLAKETNAQAAIVDKGSEKDEKPPLPDSLHLSKDIHSHGHEHEHEETGRPIGIIVLVGFLFMLIVDQASKTSCGGGRRKLSTTIGLCVHALADGVLLGSASSTRNAEVQMVVFLALIVHKGPSAFALSSLLLLEKLERFRIKRHLLIFSSSAPFGAMVTYFFLAAVKEGADYSTNLSGMFMLFSAGTFVYVAAAHVLPELESSTTGCCSDSNGPLLPSTSSSNSPSGLSIKELGVLIIGALGPVFLFAHHH